jgi:D-3-phosphoglycerate dehydrogenase/C-terminal binding protein
MREIALVQCINDDTELEDRVAAGRAIVRVHRGGPVPPEVREKAEALLLYSATAPIGHGPEAFPKCRIVIRTGVGYDTIDLDGWGRLGIPVCNVPDYGTSEVADHALALMLSLLRGTGQYQEMLHADPVQGWRFAAPPVIRRIRGLTFGVAGMGRIGTAAAARARGFGMAIALYDPYLPRGMEIALGARRVDSLAELFATSDVVSLHTPANDETRGMVNAGVLAAARPGLVLVNTARGTLVDLGALHDAMRDGRVAAAGLDVLSSEPADPGHPLVAAFLKREPWLEGRLALTPHAAFYSPEAQVDLRTKGVETALVYLETGELRNCVNAAVLAPRRGTG